MLRYLQSSGCPEVCDTPLLGIELAMEQAGIRSLSNRQSKVMVLVSRAISKLRIMRNISSSSVGPVFISFMGLSENKVIPISLWNEIIPYCFDCWPAQYRCWLSFFRRHRVRLAFFSARQSAKYFAGALPGMRCEWLPEACDPTVYRASKSWSQRDIDVLELGRKSDRFHERIREPLAARNRSHLFEQVKGRIIFPDRDGLIDGFSRTKISICFPCSKTHPERSGTVETVTLRYFESMASKCMLLGHAPQELTDLFGYNPVIEVREGLEYEQIESLLENANPYLDLVESNYRRLLEVGTWEHRVKQVLNTIGDCSLLG